MTGRRNVSREPSVDMDVSTPRAILDAHENLQQRSPLASALRKLSVRDGENFDSSVLIPIREYGSLHNSPFSNSHLASHGSEKNHGPSRSGSASNAQGVTIAGSGAVGSNVSSGWQAISAEAVYCMLSAGTILFNKYSLSTFGFPAPNALLLFQFLQAVFMLHLCHVLGLLKLDALRWDTAKTWLPVNLIFVCMNVSGFYALKYIGAGMFTVLKNLSNLLTIAGDWYFFGKRYGWQVHGCLALMIGSAALGAATDLKFSGPGYAWQLLNCVFTASYSLYLSAVITGAKAESQAAALHGKVANDDRRQPPTEIQMVYYNNVLSLLPTSLLVLGFGELDALRSYRLYSDPRFHAVVLTGGLLGFGVSFASIWCVSRTSATLFSLTGSMNKVLVALVGIYVFKEPTNMLNMCSIGMGILAGLVFVLAKTNR